jgi:hypothetical protein
MPISKNEATRIMAEAVARSIPDHNGRSFFPPLTWGLNSAGNLVVVGEDGRKVVVTMKEVAKLFPLVNMAAGRLPGSADMAATNAPRPPYLPPPVRAAPPARPVLPKPAQPQKGQAAQTAQKPSSYPKKP